MVVNTEEAAAARDMKPGVVEDLQPLERRPVVAVEGADHREQLIPAERLELLDGGVRIAEQVEMTFERRRVALREGPGIRGIAALLGRQAIALQRGVQPFLRPVATEGERDSEHVDDFRCRHSSLL